MLRIRLWRHLFQIVAPGALNALANTLGSVGGWACFKLLVCDGCGFLEQSESLTCVPVAVENIQKQYAVVLCSLQPRFGNSIVFIIVLAVTEIIKFLECHFNGLAL